jgi:cytochrome c-type protein NapB
VKTKILACLIAAGLALGGGLFASSVQADEVQSLRGKTAITQPDVTEPVFDVKEGSRYPKNYLQQPPLIPHRIEKYEIDVKVNQCLRCHDWPNNVQENAPLISVSHFTDRDGNKLDHVASRRWFCVQCHVPQADAKPLVENKFQPATGSKQ